MTDLRRSERLRDGRDLAERKCARLTTGTCDDERKLLEICCTLSRLRSKAHVHLACLVSWIDPIARFDSRESWTQCLRDLADCYSESSREPSLPLVVEL